MLPLGDGYARRQAYRKSFKTRSWERAEQIKRTIENGNRPQQPKSITVRAALEAFVTDGETRNLTASTLRKYRTFESLLNDWCGAHGLHNLVDLDNQALRNFRTTRNIAPRTASKELERIRSFFKFCIDREWLTKNPAKGIKPPKVKSNPRLPFSEQELHDIIGKVKDDRELAFILTLRHTGLRIGDCSLLRDSQLLDNRIYLYTTKAGIPVSVVIPPNLVSLLKAIPTRGGYFFLWGESTHVHSVSNLWRRRIKSICNEVGILPDHPHRFRHSLAADLLTKGASVENVAAILGNSPAVIIKHYSQWIASRQATLDAFMEQTWQPKLVRVK